MPAWIKAIVAVALLVLLFNGVNWADVPRQVAEFHPAWLLVAFLFIVLQFPSSAAKWMWSLRLHHLHYEFPYLMRVLCIGFFFNNFLPSAIGGDAYRIYRTMPPAGERLKSFSGVLVERVVGLFVMLGLGLIGALVLQDQNALARTYVGLAVLGISSGVIALVGTYAGWFKPIFTRLRKFTWFAALEANMRTVGQIRFEWIPFLFFSLAFQMLAAGILFALFEGCGIEMSFWACLLIGAAAGIASVLPISINGLGVVEGSIAGTAVALGSPYEPALMVAIMLRLLVLPMNALCGVIYMIEKKSGNVTVPA
jgi:uncharacterized protein (TIRG00374 family)